MFSRTLAFVLALVLLWSPTAVQEQAVGVAPGTVAPAGLHDAPAEQPPGTAAGRFIPDNLPAPGQTHAEAALDAQEMLTEAAAVAGPGAGSAWPKLRPAPARSGPYLDGPQRPPCPGRLVA